jgi:hypothetical protein
MSAGAEQGLRPGPHTGIPEKCTRVCWLVLPFCQIKNFGPTFFPQKKFQPQNFPVFKISVQKFFRPGTFDRKNFRFYKFRVKKFPGKPAPGRFRIRPIYDGGFR